MSFIVKIQSSKETQIEMKINGNSNWHILSHVDLLASNLFITIGERGEAGQHLEKVRVRQNTPSLNPLTQGISTFFKYRNPYK